MNFFLKKVVAPLVVIGSLAHAQLAGSLFATNVEQLKADSAIKFDFIVALDEGDLSGVRRCLEAGFDVNERWANRETPLMYAIRKLAALEEPQESGVVDFAYIVGSSFALGAGYLVCTWSKDAAREVRSLVKGKFENSDAPWTLDQRNKVVKVAAGAVGLGIGAYLAASTLYYKSKRLARYLYYRWKLSAARLGIIELLIHHPGIDLSITNAQEEGDQGTTALELVHELRHQARTNHVARLLDTVELMIIERLHNH